MHDEVAERSFRFGVIAASAPSGDEWVARATPYRVARLCQLVAPDSLRCARRLALETVLELLGDSRLIE
ncbi:MAG: hypothetical protein JO352_22750 [Chloroflexi bacterium]|nr:hypothetical protein [Chloroflexota bacterium]MBV9602936.1 hypothetical protein [Chloroflexota bacterium]